MSSMLGIDTAIGWAHWRVRGGWKNALLTVGAYTGVIVLVIVLTVQTDPRNRASLLAGWRLGLLFLQGGLLVLLAGTRVGAAVRSDITSRMIESHRLMPVSPWVAITGYLWGPTAQSVFMAAATFLVGLVVVMAAGIAPETWIGPTVVLATFAVFFWVVMAFVASVVRAPAAVVTTVVFVTLVMQGLPLILLPGLVPLLTPFIGDTIFETRARAGELSWPMLVGWTAQAWVGAALYIGAARKYRRSEDSALAILPGMMLLAGWVATSAVAMARWDDFLPDWYWRSEYPVEAALMGSFWSALVLALVPVSNAAQMRGSTVRMPAVALGCAAIILSLGLVWMDNPTDPSRAMLTTGVTCAATLLGGGYILGIAYRFSARGWVPLLIWLVLIGTGPVIFDSVLWGFSEGEEDFAMTWLAGISPGGAMVMAWGESKAQLLPGVIVQIVGASAWGAIFHLTQRGAGRSR